MWILDFSGGSGRRKFFGEVVVMLVGYVLGGVGMILGEGV